MSFPGLAALVTGIAAVWRLAVLTRTSRLTAGRVVAAVLFTSQFVSNVLAVTVVGDAVDGVAPGLASLGANLAIFAFYCGFVVFFGAAVGAGRFVRARVQVAVAAVFALTMVVTWAINLGTGTPLTYRGLTASSPTIHFVYFLAGNLYFAYALALSATLAVRAARGTAASRRGRLAFSVCALGLVLAFLGGPVTRTPSVLGLWWGWGRLPRGSNAVAQGVLNVGIATIVIGLCVLALLTTAGKFQLWLAAKRDIQTLGPLRRALHAAFPHIALHRPRGGVGELLRVRDVPFHHRRHLVECRDGLWCLSRYVEDPDGPGGDASSRPIPDQARLVADALDRVAAGAEPSSGPEAIAAPTADSGDEPRVLALARAFTHLGSDRGTPPPAGLRHTAPR